ncbi:hypothetical protein EMIT0P44_30060 [Pseudomonas sp. IT-P44]
MTTIASRLAPTGFQASQPTPLTAFAAISVRAIEIAVRVTDGDK